MPRVSAVIPTRNRRALLTRALSSIEAQHFRDFEIIVVDDGSTDGTSSWLRTNRAVSLIEAGCSRGAAAARNRGVERARGEIVAFLDDDDVWHPSYLEKQVAQLDRHPDAECSVTAHLEIDAAGGITMPDLRPLYHYDKPLTHMLAECPIHTLSIVACRRSAFARVGSFDEGLAIVHDLDWHARLIASGGRTIRCSESLVARSMPGGLVARHRKWFAEETMVQQRHFASARLSRAERRLVRTVRAMFFTRIALAKGDLPFGLRRLAEALLLSPLAAIHIATLKSFRRLSANSRGVSESAAWKLA